MIKTKTSTIEKSELEHLYFERMMTLDEIGRHFGYADRQPIIRLFKKFGIQTRSKSDIANSIFESRVKIPTKEVLEGILAEMSQTKAAGKLGVGRDKIKEWMDLYGIKSTWFKYAGHKDILTSNVSPIISTSFVEIPSSSKSYYSKKRRIETEPYDLEETLDLIRAIISSDTTHGFDRIKDKDQRLFVSIVHHTTDLNPTSKKITERVYHLIHPELNNTPINCIGCESPLKFYTLEKGYGNSEDQRCSHCKKHIDRLNKTSTELFMELDRRLGNHNDIQFGAKNTEHTVYVLTRTEMGKRIKENQHHKKYGPLLNRQKYYLDFFYNNKNIEFDGDYWHDPEKDKVRDTFLKNEKDIDVLRVDYYEYITNKEETIQKCLKFLSRTP